MKKTFLEGRVNIGSAHLFLNFEHVIVSFRLNTTAIYIYV